MSGKVCLREEKRGDGGQRKEDWGGRKDRRKVRGGCGRKVRFATVWQEDKKKIIQLT